MKCKICNSTSNKIFEKTILQKYNSGYYKCTNCFFLQTDEAVWLKEAYKSAITSLDIGMVNRNIHLQNEVKEIINSCFPESKIFLDYAGGYGMFVRLMRDIGFNFYRQDEYCKNIFAKYFDLSDLEIKKFDIVTAFEVLEHFENPIAEIEKIFNFSDTVIFSTEITPASNIDIENWWYIAPETGQHIAFYNQKSMKIIAEKFNKNYYCRNKNIHVFTSKKLTDLQCFYAFKRKSKHNIFFVSILRFLKYKIKRKTLTPVDYQYIKDLINNSPQKQKTQIL